MDMRRQLLLNLLLTLLGLRAWVVACSTGDRM